MNKVLLLFFLWFGSISLLFSNTFEALYEDLVNFWRIARQPAYLDDLTSIATPFFTGNILDFCISGYGFFVVVDDTNNKRLLTRNGHFTYDYMGYLRTTEGYYVLNTKNKYINGIDINFDERFFDDLFLVVIPLDISNVNRSGNYVIRPQYSTIPNVRVYNRVLDSVSFSLSMLLEKAIEEIAENEKFDNKEELVSLFYQRYYEIAEMDSLTSDELIELLDKIGLFVNAIRNIDNSPNKH